jgi:hypothetical protein
MIAILTMTWDEFKKVHVSRLLGHKVSALASFLLLSKYGQFNTGGYDDESFCRFEEIGYECLGCVDFRSK